MTDYANMPNVKPPQFSLNGEMERLRVEIRDRDFIIIQQQMQILKMRNCHNCKHFLIDLDVETCMQAEDVCTLPALESWELKE